MKNIPFIFTLLLSIYTSAQTLHIDKKGVKVFYEIQRTEKFISCEGSSYSNENYSKKKIYIWKVIFGIENGYSEAIVPRGVGIATISVSPDPVKPYSHNYCDYKYLENYEPNSIQRHLDQSLFIWAIRDHKVEEIKPKEVITTTTYLYLYEGQTPKLTNWQFKGYRLKKDFTSYDPILNDIVSYSKSATYLDVEKKDTIKNLKVNYNNKIKPIETRATIKIDTTTIKTTKEISLDSISIKEIKMVENDKSSADSNSIIIKKELPITDMIAIKTAKAISLDSIFVKEIKMVEINKNTGDISSIDIEKKQPVRAVETKSEVKVAPEKCPGKKALAYKKMFNVATDTNAQRGYSWLALYYTYICECETGSPDSNQLVAIINNVVDSYTTNTNDAFGVISKVSKCKAPIKNE